LYDEDEDENLFNDDVIWYNDVILLTKILFLDISLLFFKECTNINLNHCYYSSCSFSLWASLSYSYCIFSLNK
jgi:hypothetical protein